MTEKSGYELCDLLPDRIKHFHETLKTEAVSEHAAVSPSVPDFAWKLASSEAQQGMQDALHMDVLSIVARGWSLARELHEYTNGDKYPPDQTAIVFLGEHAVTTDVQPVLTLTIGEIRLRPIKFTLTLTADFRSAALLIKGGYIIGVASGDCDVSALLKYDNIGLHKPVESKHLVIPGRKIFAAPGLAIG